MSGAEAVVAEGVDEEMTGAEFDAAGRCITAFSSDETGTGQVK